MVKQLSYGELNLDLPVEKRWAFSDTLLAIDLNSLVFLLKKIKLVPYDQDSLEVL